jgi:hypothetical protein
VGQSTNPIHDCWLLPCPPTHNHSKTGFWLSLGEGVCIFRFLSLVASCSGRPAGVRNDDNPALRLPQLPCCRATTCYLRLSNWESDPNKLHWMPNTRSFVRSPRNPAQRRFSHTGQSYRLASLAQLSSERKRGLSSIISACGLSRSCDRP